METDVVVEHPCFGRGEITRVTYDTGEPRVSVKWDDGQMGCYEADELEFIVVDPQEEKA